MLLFIADALSGIGESIKLKLRFHIKKALPFYEKQPQLHIFVHAFAIHDLETNH